MWLEKEGKTGNHKLVVSPNVLIPAVADGDDTLAFAVPGNVVDLSADRLAGVVDQNIQLVSVHMELWINRKVSTVIFAPWSRVSESAHRQQCPTLSHCRARLVDRAM